MANYSKIYIYCDIYVNDKLDSIKINNNNNSNKDSGSEETNYNSSDKKESL